MTIRDDRKQGPRERLLAAAASCFAEKGCHGRSIGDVAKRAEVAPGAMHARFKNKEELF